ncbi:MAG: hypothetical protein KatS3mg090_0634 [Patescibacteria group bacterium]|nr:MAG: hypothetical protein KatS3mg090_0634 [Patescibacteria group bacterium]
MNNLEIDNFNKIIFTAKRYLVWLIFFLYPLFFLPFFRDVYSIPKNLFIIYSALLLLIFDFFYILINKKIVWRKSRLDLPLYLFLLIYGLSIYIMSPNKWQALFLSSEAYAVWIGWAIILFSAVSVNLDVIKPLIISGFLSALNIFLSFINIFSLFNLPDSFGFVKNNYFVTTGSYLESLVFVGFVLLYLIFSFVFKSDQKSESNGFWQLFENIVLVTSIIAIILGVYNIINPVEVNGQLFSLVLPPFRTSWYAAVEILKSPLTALFGVGPNNFSSIFTRVKTIDYNMSDLWTISSFNLSASFFLHILTVSGILGIASFVYYLSVVYRQLYNNSDAKLVYIFYILILLFLLLPLLPILTYLLFALSVKAGGTTEDYEINIGSIPLVYISSLGVSLALIVGGFYYSIKYTKAELFFYRGIQALNKNSAVDVFENHRKAIIEFPYLEALRRNFSQINMALAENYLNQLVEENKKEKADQEKITNLRNSLNQAIQASIDEAKAVTALNSQKAENWAFLGSIYRNILNLAQNADAWAISSYQRAVQLDPLNPNYKIELGGLFYALQQYNDAERLFESAIASKPDWANAYYNLAWTAYQKKDINKAVNAMQSVVSLMESNDKADKDSLEKAKKELEEFKKQLPSNEGSATSGADLKDQGQDQLQIPTPPQQEIDQKINLPESASPDTTQEGQ